MIDRDRITERVNLSTVKLEVRRAIRPLIALGIGFAVALLAAYYILNNINGGIGSTHTMKFQVADATGVVPGRAEVRFYGITAGQVTDTQIIHGQAVLTTTVADKFGKVYKNAIAQVRPNTALDDMYLDVVNRGTPDAGVAPANYVIPESQTQSPVNLADVLDTFQPDVRTQLYNVIDQLGNGLADRGQDLRQAFTLLAPFLQVAGNVSQQLAVRANLTKALVHNAAVLSTTLASRSTDLRTLVTQGTNTLLALSTEGGAPLKQTIAELGPAAHAVGDLVLAAHNLDPNLLRALNALGPVADELPSGLNNLQALAQSADPAVRKLETPVVKLVPLVDQLRPFSADLKTALTRIAPQVSDVDTAAQDAANCTSFINEFFNWDASMAKFYDSDGSFVRGNVHVGFYTIPTLKQSNYTYDYQCAGGVPIGVGGGVPVPKYNGPAPAP